MHSTKTLGLSILAVAALAAVACKTSEAASTHGASRDARDTPAEQTPAPRASTATVKGDNFVVSAAIAPACKVGESCTMTIKLEALGSYHINDSYPYKFTPSLTGDGKDNKPPSKCENVEFAKEQFSKANGDFKKDGEKTATLTVAFKPTAAKGKIAGVYKMSVCSEQNCQLETKPITLDVDAAK